MPTTQVFFKILIYIEFYSPICPAAHAVVAGAIRPADEDSELGHVGAGHRRHHLSTVLSDTARLRLTTHHEPYEGKEKAYKIRKF